MKIRALLNCVTVLSLAAGVCAAEDNNLAIIPATAKNPARSDGVFGLTPQTRIYADSDSLDTAGQLAGGMRPATGYPLSVKTRWFFDSPVAGAIFLTTKNANTNLGPEGYELTVTSDAVVIRAPTQAGLFYGAETLWQLLPPDIFASNAVANVNWQMPCVHLSRTGRGLNGAD